MKRPHYCERVDGNAVTVRTRSPWFLLKPPERPVNAVPRERLRSVLTEHISAHAVTIVSAPAGSGKTLAVSEWAETCEEAVAWLTLTRYETNSARIHRGLVSTLQRLADGPDGEPYQRLRSLRLEDSEPAVLVDSILGAFADIDDRVVIVVDDAHLAGAALGESIFTDLADIAPQSLRIVFVGRGILGVPVERWCARNRAVVVGADELSLTTDEVLMAASRYGIAVGREAADSLRRETHGWPIAVRAALSAAGSNSTLIHAPGLHSLKHPIGIRDYIAQEVLANLRPELREFILAATTCSRLGSELAEHLSGRSDAGALLEECVASGLFVQRITDIGGRTIYCWHALFASQSGHLDWYRLRERQTVE